MSAAGTPRVLLVTAHPPLIEAALRHVQDMGGVWCCVTDAEGCREACATWQPDLLLLDETIPWSLAEIKGASLGAFPSVLALLHDAHDQAVEAALARGADDVVTRDSQALLGLRMRRLLAARSCAASLQANTPRPCVDTLKREHAVFVEALRGIASALTGTLDLQVILDTLVDYVARLLPGVGVDIHLIERDRLRAVAWRGYTPEMVDTLRMVTVPLALPSYQHLLNSRQPLTILDTREYPGWVPLPRMEWIRAYLSIPVTAYDQVVGFLSVTSAIPNAFRDADVEHLRAFAALASVALENAERYAAVSNESAHMRVLYNATHVLFTSSFYAAHDLDALCALIARTVVKAFNLEDCGVVLVDRANGCFTQSARAGSFEAQGGVVPLEGQGAMQRALYTGEMVYTPKLVPDDRSEGCDPRTRSRLLLPMHASLGVIGLLDAQSPREEAFSSDCIHQLRAFAERAAIAVENVQLYQHMQQQTQRLQAHVDERTNELNRIKERLEAILNHISDGILLLDPHGLIQQTNSACNTLLEYAADDLFATSIVHLVVPEHQGALAERLEAMLVERAPARLQVQACTRTGGRVDVDVSLSPVVDWQGQVRHVVCSMRDVRQFKRLESDLRQAFERQKELNELKSRFITTVSHEFRTPLTLIYTATDLIRNYGDRMTSEQRLDKLTRMQANVHHMVAMLDDLLTIGRTTEAVGNLPFKPEPFDMAQLCRDVIHEQEVGIGVEHHFLFTCEGVDFTITADYRLMRRTLVNLLTNAVKYSEPASQVRVGLLCAPDQTVLRVSDQGVGIPDADKAGVFEVFYRGRNVEHIGGVGLGLTIVRQAVDLHKGRIEFESVLGTGTTFTVYLPVGSE